VPTQPRRRTDATRIEAQRSLGPVAESHGAEPGRARVDPVALDAEDPGELGRVDIARGGLGVFAHELSDAQRDGLDVVGIEPYRGDGALPRNSSSVRLGRHAGLIRKYREVRRVPARM
jgi:hypothetical protein